MTKYRRRIRILCLHGVTQSSASFRAALKPVCDQMASNWEFHFLDAPFIIPDPDEDASGESASVWSSAAVLASRLAAIDSSLAIVGKDNSADKGLQVQREETWKALSGTPEGQQTWNIQQSSGADGVESFVSTKVAKSMSRGWVAHTSDGRAVGVDAGLAMIGDYMRENGTFHGVIGYGDSACTLALLLQSLLSHPRSSSAAFPTFFARLPQGVARMPRMGGWEEEPPAPDDERLGAENLTKDFVPAQKPFEVVVVYHPVTSDSALGIRASQWLDSKRPILRTAASPNSFANHSLAIQQQQQRQQAQQSQTPSLEHSIQYQADISIFNAQSSAFLKDFLRLAIESCEGSQDARSQLSDLQDKHKSDGQVVSAKL